MKYDLPRLAATVFNTPLMFHRGQLDTVLSVVGPRIIDGLEVDPQAFAPERPERAAMSGGARRFEGGGYMDENGVAVLPIIGTTVRRGSWLDAMCGMASYSMIQDAITEMMTDPSVRGIMLEMDTPGGEAGGVFDLSEFIREASEMTGKPVWAHANELAASAGYAIASAAESIWLAQTAEVGSIGVVAAHIDVSERDKSEGVRWSYIYAGDKKVDGNPHERLSDRARNDIQADVDSLYADFVGLVSQNRGIEADKIRDTQADMFRGARAVEAELADEVGTFDEAMTAFAAHLDEIQTPGGRVGLSQTRREIMAGKTTGTQRNAASPTTESDRPKGEDKDEDDMDAETGAEAPEEDDQASETEGEGEAKKKAAAALSKVQPGASAEDERKRCAALSGVATQAARLGVGFDLNKAIASGMSVDAAREAVLTKAAEQDAGKEIVTASGSKEKPATASKEAARAARKRGLTGKR